MTRWLPPWRAGLSITVITLIALACGFGTHPDESGHYDALFPQAPLPDNPCFDDEDCVITCRTDGNCCGEVCSPCRQVFNKQTYLKLVEHETSICTGEGYECPVAKCPRSDVTFVARCVDNLCNAVETQRIRLER